MTGYEAQAVVAAAVFAGALVSGFTGFAFSAVAGSLLLHVLEPIDAVPFMMACSTAVQSLNLLLLRRTMNWRGSAVFILGGAAGVPLALYLLLHLDASAFRIGFGLFLATYAAYMLIRSNAFHLTQRWHRTHDAAVGFAGGLLGGLTAMPGALPTIWCDMRGLPKHEQRGLVQPFIAAMQVLALAILVAHGNFTQTTTRSVLYSLPVLAIGTGLGIALFGRLSDRQVRRAVLGALFVSGLAFFV